MSNRTRFQPFSRTTNVPSSFPPRELSQVFSTRLGPFRKISIMSYNPDLANYEAQAFALAAHNVWVTRVCQLCPCIIFCYDYLLTLDREVEFIWRQPMRSSNILYIIVRFAHACRMPLNVS